MRRLAESLRLRLRLVGQKADAYTLNERLLLFGAALLVLVYSWNQWFLRPLDQQRAALSEKTGELQATIRRFDVATTEWLSAASFDPDADIRARTDMLNAQLAEASARIEARAGHMVPPDRMPQVLGDVLDHFDALQFEALEGLPATPVVPDTTEPASLASGTSGSEPTTTRTAYRHGFRLRFSGSFAEIASYLHELEQLPHGFFWEGLTIDASGFPRVEGTLVVYTVSLSPGWIGV